MCCGFQSAFCSFFFAYLICIFWLLINAGVLGVESGSIPWPVGSGLLCVSISFLVWLFSAACQWPPSITSNFFFFWFFFWDSEGRILLPTLPKNPTDRRLFLMSFWKILVGAFPGTTSYASIFQHILSNWFKPSRPNLTILSHNIPPQHPTYQHSPFTTATLQTQHPK